MTSSPFQPRLLRVFGSNTKLRAGEKLTAGDLLHAMMLASGNHAAMALALHTAPTVDNFVERMNEKAQKMGAARSRFVNPTACRIPSS